MHNDKVATLGIHGCQQVDPSTEPDYTCVFTQRLSNLHPTNTKGMIIHAQVTQPAMLTKTALPAQRMATKVLRLPQA